ncbi:MAG: NAD-dependent epimerase/dehydratase family protein [Candidatus Latescibacteria bacterium]|jgi:nucleoside-diphosphate-sugar epimerase|nr:NAD-dependent epimerase/dehydratase family protein [Candidatus Latescibacterota bacterium]
MKIVVTGSSGQIGRFVMKDLVAAGHTAIGWDVKPPAEEVGSFERVDITDEAAVQKGLAQADAGAVIHLGAWANSGIVSETQTYGDNTRGTFNVFFACAEAGIKRVVSASSGQVYGLAQAPPLYVPMDEDHPLMPVNAYAHSKVAGEGSADYFVANHGMTILSFRFMGIRAPERLAEDIERVAADPAKGGWLLWTRTDARDAAAACRLACEAETVESGPYNITGPRVVLDEDTMTLVRRHFGAGVEVQGLLPGTTSPLGCARARQAFAYEPAYAWSVSQQHPVT